MSRTTACEEIKIYKTFSKELIKLLIVQLFTGSMGVIICYFFTHIDWHIAGGFCERGEGSSRADLIRTVKTGRKSIGHATMTKLCISLRMRKGLIRFVARV